MLTSTPRLQHGGSHKPHDELRCEGRISLHIEQVGEFTSTHSHTDQDRKQSFNPLVDQSRPGQPWT